MTQTGTSNAIVNAMLGWLKGLASWVLRLFNLSGGISPLRFLANNWLRLLVLLLVVGMVVDLIIWLIRWRPHWVWFRKKRVIINDKNFFAGENEVDDEDDWALPQKSYRAEREDRRRRNWQDNDFVVAGAARREREERKRQQAMQRRARAARVKSLQIAQAGERESTDVFRDGLFNVNAKQKFSDRYEDEVFSVSNLPRPEEDAAGEKRQKRPAKARAKAPQARKKAPRRGETRRNAEHKKRRTSVNKR